MPESSPLGLMASGGTSFFNVSSISARLAVKNWCVAGCSCEETFRVSSDEHLAAHQFFNAKRAEIELTLKKLVPPLAISPSGLVSGIHHLGDNIAAALQLGDMNYVSGEMDWLKTLMQAHDRPAAELVHFMQSYAEAVDRHINGSGRPITDWLILESTKTAL